MARSNKGIIPLLAIGGAIFAVAHGGGNISTGDPIKDHLNALADAKAAVSAAQKQLDWDQQLAQPGPPETAEQKAYAAQWSRCMSNAHTLNSLGGEYDPDAPDEPGIFSGSKAWGKYERYYGCGPGPVAHDDGNSVAREQLPADRQALADAKKKLAEAQAAIAKDQAGAKAVAPPQTPPTAQSTAKAAIVAAAPTPVAANAQGVADRQAWEAWFASKSGGYRSGALYWSGQRSLAKPGACTTLKTEDGKNGCLAAKAMLDPFDARRKTEPDYRLGWNSVAAPRSADAKEGAI
jgi:hypothetical protein